MSAIIKSDHDSRNYRMIILKNGLRVVLVSSLKPNKGVNGVAATNLIDEEDDVDMDSAESLEDEDASMDSSSDESDGEDESDEESDEKMSSVALSVGVGCFLDPEDVPGLAHLVEHMVFMGSKKYPKENAFDEYVTKKGGYNNAHTDMEETVFELEINKKYFEKALDMFANFFIEPLMAKDSLNREIEAVDSEFKLAAPKDENRLYLIFSKLAKPGHPMSQFCWGNLDSLQTQPKLKNIDVYQKIHEFKNKYYVAQLMTLAIQSMDTLDHLEEMVRSIFEDIPSSDLQRPSFEDLKEPFNTPDFPKLFHVLPVEALHKIVLTWSLPSLLKEYKIKPLKLVQCLVDHEGKGGLVAYLRKKQWALNIEAGNSGDGSENNSTHYIFEISILLTDEGMKNICEILCSTFQYLEMIRRSDLFRFFKEIQQVKQYAFNWREEDQYSGYVESLSQNLQVYPPEYLLVGPELFFTYDEKFIFEYIDLLKSNNVNVVVLSSLNSTEDLNLVEPYSNAKYSIQEIPQDWIKTWHDNPVNSYFHLPPPNEFLAENFDISSPDQPPSEHPINLIKDEYGSVWYKKDVKFEKPLAYIRYNFIIPHLSHDVLNSVMTDLFIECLNQKIGEEFYSAYFAELYYSLTFNNHSHLQFKFEGFNDKLHLLVENIMKCMKNFVLEEELFESMKCQLAKDYYNGLLKPEKLVHTLLFHILDQDHFSRWVLYNALSQVTFDLMKEFIANFWASFYFESLYQGNLTTKEVTAMHTKVKEILISTPLDSNLIPKLRICKLPNEAHCLRVASFNKNDSNSVVYNYYQSLPLSIENLSYLELLNTHIREPLFDNLRTKHQLGYDVDCFFTIYHNLLSFRVQVVYSSEKFKCAAVIEKIDHFMKEFFEKHLKEKQSSFNEQVESLIEVKSTPDVNLEDEIDRNWKEILTQRYCFDHLVKEIDFLRSVKHKDYKKWVTSSFLSSSKLSIQVLGKNETSGYAIKDFTTDCLNVELNYIDKEPGVSIRDINDFKRNLSYLHIK